MEILNRKQVSKISDEYKEVLDREKHHKHELIMVNGVIRWKGNKEVDDLNVNDVVRLLYKLGYDKNSEVYRKYYRDLGYSLSGYWEVFYWEANNENQNEYRPSLVRRLKNIIKNYCH
jgi:hypothetical protein